jgi:transcriptional regulator with XRE-family HTH domain
VRTEGQVLRLKNKNDADSIFLRQLGKHIENLILDQGYQSAYDFWVKKASSTMSRATLNYVLAGETDPKISTLRAIADLLGVSPQDVFDFNAKPSIKKAQRSLKRAKD